MKLSTRLITLMTIMYLVIISCTDAHENHFDWRHQADTCHTKITSSIRQLQGDYTVHARNILEGQTQWNTRPNVVEEWCSGFWPGVLWYDYALSGDSAVMRAAEGWTEALHDFAYQSAYDHDLGFEMIASYLNGYRFTGREDYKQVLLAAADTLATLFNPTVGTILSWPRHVKDYGGHNTIMDNMINLELLFWAGQENDELRIKNDELYDIAVRHAETTMQNHFREDGSCYHVAVYDTLDGHFVKGVTHQGYADSSMWSRGQSWAIYGYTMVYNYTHDRRFLEHAQKVTDIYLKRLHETSDDWVPLWDMDFHEDKSEKRKEENEIVNGKCLNCKFKDVSAACVVASALIDLSRYVGGDDGRRYLDAAINMLRCVSQPPYWSGTTNAALLLHSVGNYPAGSEIDASIIYADYYYMEALWKLSISNFYIYKFP